jgi:hypothetical protein
MGLSRFLFLVFGFWFLVLGHKSRIALPTHMRVEPTGQYLLFSFPFFFLSSSCFPKHTSMESTDAIVEPPPALPRLHACGRCQRDKASRGACCMTAEQAYA